MIKLKEDRNRAAEQVKRQIKDAEAKWKVNKKEILDRVKTRPLLVESGNEMHELIYINLILFINTATSQKDRTMQKMIALREIEDKMKKEGVKNPRAYFNEDEKELLADADYLEKNGYGHKLKADNASSRGDNKSRQGTEPEPVEPNDKDVANFLKGAKKNPGKGDDDDNDDYGDDFNDDDD
jgi:hypothetical protein